MLSGIRLDSPSPGSVTHQLCNARGLSTKLKVICSFYYAKYKMVFIAGIVVRTRIRAHNSRNAQVF